MPYRAFFLKRDNSFVGSMLRFVADTHMRIMGRGWGIVFSLGNYASEIWVILPGGNGVGKVTGARERLAKRVGRG